MMLTWKAQKELILPALIKRKKEEIPTLALHSRDGCPGKAEEEKWPGLL